MPDTRAEVLVVDDDSHLRQALTRALDAAGFQVSAAPEASSALDFLRQGKRFDVIITDLLLPGMEGVDFLRSVRRLDLVVPLIVMTGYPTLETAVATVRYGGFRYFDKPVAVDVLIDTVREATAMHRLAVLKRRALELYEAEGWLLGDRASIEAHFDRALDKLSRVAGRLDLPEAFRETVSQAINELSAIRDAARTARGEARKALAAQLTPIDTALVGAARESLNGGVLDQLRRDAEADLASYRTRLAADLWGRSVERALDQLVREHLGLPTLSLDV